MHQPTKYAIIYRLREAHPLSQFLQGARRIIREEGIEITDPTLGDHVTILPPCQLNPQYAAGLAKAFAFCEIAADSHKWALPVEGSHYDFFRNPGSDAFILRLDISPHMIRATETWRNKIPYEKWIYPIHGNSYNPHAAIGENPKIYPRVQALLDKGAFQKILPSLNELSGNLGIPQVLVRKPGTVWQRVTG